MFLSFIYTNRLACGAWRCAFVWSAADLCGVPHCPQAVHGGVRRSALHRRKVEGAISIMRDRLPALIYSQPLPNCLLIPPAPALVWYELPSSSALPCPASSFVVLFPAQPCPALGSSLLISPRSTSCLFQTTDSELTKS
jgi:hypothetical protein